MDEPTRRFLREARVEDYEKSLEKLGLKQLADLDDLEPDDLDEVGMDKLSRRRFDRALKEWKQCESEAKRRRLNEVAGQATHEEPAAAAASASLERANEPRTEAIAPQPVPESASEAPSRPEATAPDAADQEVEGPAKDVLLGPRASSTDRTLPTPARAPGSGDTDGLLRHLSTLGQEPEGGTNGSGVFDLMADEIEPGAASQHPHSAAALLVGIQTDLQDAMHVAKLVTNSEGVLAFCNRLVPGSGRSAPGLRINFTDLSAAPGLQLQGLLGERKAVHDFLESLQVEPSTLGMLKDPGLYAVRKDKHLFLVYWPAEGGWTEPAQRRQLVNFVHFIFRLTREICWLVGQKDLEAVTSQKASAARAGSSRNMDLRISMKSTCGDDCSFGTSFRAPWQLQASGQQQSREQSVCFFSGRQISTVGQVWRQDARTYETTGESVETIINFWREVQSTHCIYFNDSMSLDNCAEFLRTVGPEEAAELEKKNMEKRRELDMLGESKRNAINEHAHNLKAQLGLRFKSAVEKELMDHFPKEFCLFRGIDVECPICLGSLDGHMVRMPCDARHVFHKHCIENAVATNGPSCPNCNVAAVGDPICELVDIKAAMDFKERFDQASAREEKIWYLPKMPDNIEVLTPHGESMWKLDHRDHGPFVKTNGLAFRATKDMDDKVVGRHVVWGGTVRGLDEGDGWIKCRVQEQPIVGTWVFASEPSRVFTIFDLNGARILKDGSLQGELRDGTGEGAGRMYVSFERIDMRGVAVRQDRSMRVQVVDDNTLEVNIRQYQGARWEQSLRVLRRRSSYTYRALMDHMHLICRNIRLSFTFAVVATAQKWSKDDFAATAKSMMLDAISDPQGFFNKWYDKLVPTSRSIIARATGMQGAKSMSKDQVKAEISKELQKGCATDYIRMIQSCSSELNQAIYAWIDKTTETLFATLYNRTQEAKQNEVDMDRRKKIDELDSELRIAYSKAMTALAPENAQRLVLKQMWLRHGRMYRFSFLKEVSGRKELCGRVEEIQVEKAKFQAALESGSKFTTSLQSFGTTSFSDLPISSLFYLGALDNWRLLIVMRRHDGHLEVNALNRTTKVTTSLLHIKRTIDVVAFNETLRMLAAFSSDMGTVAVYAWDDAFARHHEYCPPIVLSVYQQEADLLRMHFLPAAKQLCFVFKNNFVRIYELTSNTMRPRGFSVGPHIDTLTDSAGTAILAIRRAMPPASGAKEVGNDPGTTANEVRRDLPQLRKGDRVYRKGDPCVVVEVNQATIPAHVVVRYEDGHEVGTEEHLLDRVPQAAPTEADCDMGVGSASSQANVTAEHSGGAGKEVAPIEMEVYITADGRRVKTLPLPAELHTALGREVVPALSVVRLYGKDFLLAADPAHNGLWGWQLRLQTAEQVCSVEQMRSTRELSRAPEGASGAGACQLDVLYQVFSKYALLPALATGVEASGAEESTQLLRRLVVIGPNQAAAAPDTEEREATTRALQSYVDRLVARLRQDTQKPELSTLHFDVLFFPVESCLSLGLHGAVSPAEHPVTDLGELMRKVICLVPIQIARAENEAFLILKDGLREEAADFSHLRELADFISFGLYETILEQNENRVVVISSMGKQSTGKSYMLNHLAGTCFDTSGARCTDGVWMTVREFQKVTYVMLDFEGLGSFERSAQEDMLLSVFNAAISHVALFRTEMRLDCDTAGIFSRMQQGAKLIEGDTDLFNGMFQIVVKDVVSDANEVAQEFAQKIHHITSRDKEENFFLRLYNGDVGILPFPALGRAEFYQEFAPLTEKVRQAKSFESGRHFMQNAKLLMSKIAMKDWTPTDQNKIKILLASLRECLPWAVAAGCMELPKDDCPTPLLNLRTNKTFSLPAPSVVGEKIPPLGPVAAAALAALADEGLVLAEIKAEETGGWEVFVSSSTMEALSQKVRQAVGTSTVVQNWREALAEVLEVLCERRRGRIEPWLEANLDHIRHEGDAQLLMMEAKKMLAQLAKQLRLCDHGCESCKLLCILPAGHDSAEAHSCGTDHRCHRLCEYCSEVHTASACSLAGGHDGPHDCGDASHTCGEDCSLSMLGNCGKRCVLKPGHGSDVPHMCGATKHFCGKSCALSGCSNTCIIPHEQTHDRCECHVIVCPMRCSFSGCTFMCSAQDHFHASAGDNSNCMCDQPHACPHECESQGICEIYSELVVKKKNFRGLHDTFDYDAIETEQNGIRKKCCKVVPAGERNHDGGHIHSTTDNVVHYCDVKCPTCGYYCTEPWGHSGEHSTRHGNMRKTFFVSDQDVFTVGSRKYAPSESGVAEMCNMYCHSAGRGHTHVKLCADYARRAEDCCVSALPGRRHSCRKYKPRPEEPKDEFTHAAFWESIGFKDPCSSEDKELFAKCNHFCPHRAHTGEGEQQSFCTLPLWHEPLCGTAKRDYIAQHGGAVSTDGHHFGCVHKTAKPVHTIFLMDTSGSMGSNDARPQTLPWRRSHPNRLGCVLAAVQSFVEKRRGTSEDLLSFVAFDTSVTHGPRGVPISNFDSQIGWLQGLKPSYQTDFNAAVSGLTEVIRSVSGADYRAMVIMLTDGDADYPSGALPRVFHAARRHCEGKPIRFHTVQFPSHDGRAGVMEQIAAAARQAAAGDEFASGSSFLASIDGISLQEAFVGIAESLSGAAGGLLVDTGC